MKRNERGASAVEYALLVAAIAMMILPATVVLGKVMEGIFLETCQEIAATNGTTCRTP